MSTIFQPPIVLRAFIQEPSQMLNFLVIKLLVEVLATFQAKSVVKNSFDLVSKVRWKNMYWQWLMIYLGKLAVYNGIDVICIMTNGVVIDLGILPLCIN